MTKTSKQFMSAFALSAAALFLGGCKKDAAPTENPDEGGAAVAEPDQGADVDTPDEATADEMVKCFGINECKGESVCNVNKPELGIEHACAGENDCQGKGWIKVPASECDEKGGEVLS